MYPLEDIWGEPVFIDDFVYFSRPSGKGSSAMAYGKVVAIREKNFTVQRLNRDGTEYQPGGWEAAKVVLNKGYNKVTCSKIVKVTMP